ncbi:MAG: hypothetical protein JOS17DRAFT_765790 [Linnemannia elongata]|nr:MAG: hypothetical protein JOS17DRAFT_765790 [Linnemannia elongata]
MAAGETELKQGKYPTKFFLWVTNQECLHEFSTPSLFFFRAPFGSSLLVFLLCVQEYSLARLTNQVFVTPIGLNCISLLSFLSAFVLPHSQCWAMRHSNNSI